MMGFKHWMANKAVGTRVTTIQNWASEYRKFSMDGLGKTQK